MKLFKMQSVLSKSVSFGFLIERKIFNSNYERKVGSL